VIVAELGQLLLNSGNRRQRRSGYRISRAVIGVVGRILLVIIVIVTEWVTPPIRASIISAAVVRATIPMASVPVMAVATAVTSDKVAMAAVESATMESSPVKPSATMASAAVGECSRSDRQHSGKDQSDNLISAHYRKSFLQDCRAASPGTIIGFADSISAEMMAIIEADIAVCSSRDILLVSSTLSSHTGLLFMRSPISVLSDHAGGELRKT
jgi:hypothetical protein